MIKPIKVQCDTGASQTLMLENILPLSGKTSADANVLLQGVDPGFHSVLLHHIKFKSDLISGQVVVGVRPTLHFLWRVIPCKVVVIWLVTRLY